MQQKMILPWQNKLHSLCIGFSGSAQTGKTTMAEEVAQYLTTKYLEDCLPPYWEEKKLTDKELTDRQLMKVYMDLLARKKAIERSFTKFVADTTVLDYSTAVLTKLGNAPEMQRGVMDYIRECGVHAAETYDVIFLLPYRNDQTPLPAQRALQSMLVEKSAQDGQPIFVVHVLETTTRADRLGECLEVIDKVSDVKVRVANEQQDIKTPVTTEVTQ